MLKKTITYEDLDGNKVTEEFHFKLNTPEITEFATAYGNDTEGIEAYFKWVVDTKDSGALIALLKDLVSRSIGKRAEDGKRFMKNEEIRLGFMESDAWPTFFMQLAENPAEMVEFFSGVVPSNMSESMRARMNEETVELPAEDVKKTYTRDELLKLTDDEFDMVAGTDFRKMTQDQQYAAFQRKAG